MKLIKIEYYYWQESNLFEAEVEGYRYINPNQIVSVTPYMDGKEWTCISMSNGDRFIIKGNYEINAIKFMGGKEEVAKVLYE